MSTQRKKHPNPKEPFPIEKLSFYFDEVERDRMDALGSSARAADVIQIRNHLLTLPEDQFLPTLQAIKKILQGQTANLGNQNKEDKNPKNKSTLKTKAQDRDLANWSSDHDLEEPPAAVVKILHQDGPSDPPESD